MSKRNVRVELFVDEPDDTLKLCDAILEKHTALGVGSPLTGFFDMTEFAGKVTSAKGFRKQASKDDRASQSKFNACRVKCGIAEGQNKQTTGTLYYMVLSIRDFLLLKFRLTPESLSLWGFNVVVTQTNGKRNVRVDIPDDTPEGLLALCNAISEKHIDDALTSILTDSEVDMAAYTTLLGEANTLLAQCVTLRGTRQSNNDQALAIIGYSEGQTAETPGTLYNFNTGFRDRLLNKHQGVEETLSEYGFDVVISASSSADNEETPPTPPPGG
jgi:hypothetical protein